MENILVCSTSLITVIYKLETVPYFYALLINCLACAALSAAGLEASRQWQRLSRPKTKLTLYYGCVVVPAILSFDCDKNQIACSDASGSICIAFFSLLFFVEMEEHYKYLITILLCCLFVYLWYLPWQIHNIEWIGVKLFVFVALFYACMKGCPYSFSVGECVVVCQLMTCLCSRSSISIFESSNFLGHVAISSALFIGLLILMIAVGFSFISSQINRSVYFYTAVLIIFTAIVLSTGEQLLNDIKKLFTFLLSNHPYRGILLFYCVLVVALCCLYTIFRQTQQKASTAERKVYHIFVLLVFIPGLLYDIPLLILQSVLVLGAFVVIGIVHAFKIEPFGQMLHGVLNKFTSKQDTGILILTPTYLLFGLSLPVWLCFLQHPDLLWDTKGYIPIKCFSGILSVGIGDAVASVVGSKYGKLQIPGTHKTLEGTVASIFSQLLFVFFLAHFSQMQVSLMYIVFATVVVAFVEAFTDEIDNLVLPILMYLLVI